MTDASSDRLSKLLMAWVAAHLAGAALLAAGIAGAVLIAQWQP